MIAQIAFIDLVARSGSSAMSPSITGGREIVTTPSLSPIGGRIENEAAPRIFQDRDGLEPLSMLGDEFDRSWVCALTIEERPAERGVDDFKGVMRQDNREQGEFGQIVAVVFRKPIGLGSQPGYQIRIGMRGSRRTNASAVRMVIMVISSGIEPRPGVQGERALCRFICVAQICALR